MVFHIDNAQKITLDPPHVMHDDVKKKTDSERSPI